ncbi:MAG: imelysin family protein [Rhodobacteraceae bacterium]|nr:imelysin family protein [Paracoccaceae bacterium]
MRWLLLAVALSAASPAMAEPEPKALAAAAVETHVLPAYERLKNAAGALVEAAPSCDGDTLRPAYHALYDAWMGVQHIGFGPIERDNRRFAVAFWPDSKGFAKKAQDRLTAEQDPVVDDPEAFEKISVAGRGLLALERLLYDENGEIALGEGYRCRLARAIATDLARTAGRVVSEWQAPAPPATVRDLFASLDGGLQALTDLRLGRPLGSFANPRPRRAEAWRSGRSLSNIQLSLTALRDLCETAFAPQLPDSDRDRLAAGFEKTAQLAERTPSPLHEAVATPAKRIAVEALQTQTRALQGLVREIVAPAVGVSITFNSLDGD